MPFALIAAPHTPFNAAGGLAPQVVTQQARHLSASGVNGVFLGGTTGECTSLTTAERLELAAAWAEAAREHRLRMFVHVGHNAQQDALALIEQAVALRADAVAALAPSYFKPASVRELMAFLEPLVAAASPLPFYYYDIPALTGVRLSMVELLREAARWPNFAGLKYTNPDLIQLQQCLRAAEGRYEILFGVDELLLPARALGVAGAVGSTYNFAAPHYRRMLAAWDAGDTETARRLQLEAIDLVEILAAPGYMAAAKHLMESLGVPVGGVRPPLTPLTAQAAETLGPLLNEHPALNSR